MIEQNDIQKVSLLPIEQVADALGLKVARHWSLCPYHNDSKPSLHFNVGKNKFRCYVCDHYGGPIDLCMQVEGLNFRDAVRWLAQTFGITIANDSEKPMRGVKRRQVIEVEKHQEVKAPDISRLTYLVEHPTITDAAKAFLFDERKLDPRVIRWCGINSNDSHLIIPYFGLDGRLKSIQWRYLGRHAKKQIEGEPRFRFLKGSQCHVYNLQILRMLKPDEPLFVTEGCSDCWAMMSAGHKAIAIPSATLLKPDDLRPLCGLSLHMYPDNDKPGERLFLKLREVTDRITRHQLPEGCKDFAEYYVQKLLNR